MEDTLIFVQKLVECTLGISLAHIPCSEQELITYLCKKTDHIFDTLLLGQLGYGQRILNITGNHNTIYEYRTFGGITLLFYSDIPGESLYILGPLLTKSFDPESLRNTNAPIPPQLEGQMMDFCSRLPVVPSHRLYRTADLVFGRLTGRSLPLKISQADIPQDESNQLLDPLLQQSDDISQMRQVEMRYEYSAALTEAIRQGNMSLVLHIVGRYSPGMESPIRNANPLRNAQNYCIVMNTQLRHAVESCGIHPYLVDKLSNRIGMEIEQLKDTAKLPAFFESVIRRYCQMVQEHAYPDLKPLVNLAVTYIKEHLSDNLTVKDTARALTVNANYLSGQFHQQMGMTFIDFVNQERAHQAASLLQTTNLQIQEIGALVGYNNTSYFAKQFRRFFGQSPQDYRENMHI